MDNWTFEKCYDYSPLNPKADKFGMVTFWRGYNESTGAYVYSETEGGCIAQAKRAEGKDERRRKKRA